jgi:hypothetical protein
MVAVNIKIGGLSFEEGDLEMRHGGLSNTAARF